jgi:DNA-binding CsgD family transcriptional regulator
VIVGGSADRLLERDGELGVIRAMLAQARSGEGRIVVVEGPAGIGKSALLQAAGALAHEEGFEVLAGRGAELEGEFPFGVARQLFEPALAALPDADRADVISGAAELSQRVIGDAPTDLGDASALAAALHGLYWLCANLAERSPLLVVVDDAHWTDLPTLRWLAYLAHRLGGLRVAVIAAMRPGPPDHVAQVLDDLRRPGDVEMLSPAPLSENAVRHLIEETFGGAAEEEFVRALHEQSAGNPLMARELASALAADGGRADTAAAERIGSLPPDGALRTVLVKLGRLPRPASELARAVAVLGTGVRLGDAAQVAELDPRAAAEAADSLIAAGILVAEPLLRFAHPLLRAAVYEDISPARRAADHARAAELLRSDPDASEHVTAHLLASEPSGADWVVEHLRAAARVALSRGAPESAVSMLERCLAERPDRDVRAAVLYEIGVAERRFAPWAAIPRLTEAHEAAAETRERIAIARELAFALALSARLHEAFELLERTHAEVPEDDRELALAIEAELLTIGLYGPGLADRVDARIAALPQLDGATPGERLVLANVARRREMVGESVEEAADMAERAVADGQLLQDQVADSGMYALALVPIALAGRYDTVERLCQYAVGDATRRGSPIGLSQVGAVQAFIAFLRGNLRSAQAQADATLELARETRFPPVIASAVRVLVEVAIERGELDDADALLVDNHFAGDVPDVYVFFNFVLRARGCLRLAQGRTDEAIADLLEVGERERAARHGAPTPWRSVVAPALAARGEVEFARRLVAEDLEIERRRARGGFLAMALRGAAAVEGGDTAIEHLREAARILESGPRRLEYAITLADLGAALRRANQRAEARDHLREALDIAHRCGATVLAERAREELLATGARPRKNILSGIDALTASERRVADLAAQGLTNKQIAQALFVSPRTVATHLEHTYSKLDIKARQDLAAKLAVAG